MASVKDGLMSFSTFTFISASSLRRLSELPRSAPHFRYGFEPSGLLSFRKLHPPLSLRRFSEHERDELLNRRRSFFPQRSFFFVLLRASADRQTLVTGDRYPHLFP